MTNVGGGVTVAIDCRWTSGLLPSTMSNSDPIYTLIGTPFSTFTRTIALGLQYKGLQYNQIATVPHSEIASDCHPFGYLPTLIIHERNGSDRPTIIKLSESQAILRYIDRIAPEPTLQLVEGSGRLLPEKMWEFSVSLHHMVHGTLGTDL